jgi:hypothetical protein
MMEGAGLGLAVVTTFKELYLISKFIYRVIHSVRNSKTERQDLEQEFHLELLYLQSFGHLIITNDGIMKEGPLNTVSDQCLISRAWTENEAG